DNARKENGAFEYLKAKEPVAGLDALRSPVFSETVGIARYWFQSLVVPGSHIFFVAQSTSRSEVERLIASARIVPPGSAGPPLVAGEDVAAARTALGDFDVHVREVPSPYRSDTVIDSNPGFGTPLRPGSVITLTVSSGLGDEPVM